MGEGLEQDSASYIKAKWADDPTSARPPVACQAQRRQGSRGQAALRWLGKGEDGNSCGCGFGLY